MKTRKFFAGLLLPAALGVLTLTALSCGDTVAGMDMGADTGPAGGGETKKGGGSDSGSYTVEFNPQGGVWVEDGMPEDFWESVLNEDGTVNLPTAYLQRGGMILVGWYDRPQAEAPQEPEAPETMDDDLLEPQTENTPPKPAPYLLSGEPVPSAGLFTEGAKLTANVTLYAWWQERDPGAYIVNFIPYWTEGAQGVKRQALAANDYKISAFPPVTGGPEHYHPVGDGGSNPEATWWTAFSGGEVFTPDTPVTEEMNNMTLYGHWEANKYKVTFNVNDADIGGNNPAVAPIEVPYNSVVTAVKELSLPQSPSGYAFLGWYKEQKPSITDAKVPAANDANWFMPNADPVTGNITVYGLWQNRPAGSWKVTFIPYFKSGDIVQVDYALPSNDYKLSPPTVPQSRPNYTLRQNDWYYMTEEEYAAAADENAGDAGAVFTADTALAADSVVYAKWDGVEYQVTFDWQTGNNNDSQIIKLTYPNNTLAKAGQTLPAAAAHPRAHYHLSDQNWRWNSAVFDENTQVNGSITVSPVWAGDVYTVTYRLNLTESDNSIIQNDSVTYPVQTLELLENKPKQNGHIFNGWWTSRSGGIRFTNKIESVLANRDVYAQWVKCPDGWTYLSASGGMEKTFTSSGAYVSFTTIASGGGYKIEAWGASGGSYYASTSTAGYNAKGGYSSGVFNLKSGQPLYVYVGGKGSSGGNSTSSKSGAGGSGGWNGGGAGGSGYPAISYYPGGGGGGGAADVRFESGVLNTRLIVAGGGGGSGYNDSSMGYGGEGGGSTGTAGKGGSSITYAGGSQTSGNAFGTGQTGGNGSNYSASKEGRGGGGGGYYGGKASAGGESAASKNAGGGGGSGFVYGYTAGASDAGNKMPSKYEDYKAVSGTGICLSGDNTSITGRPTDGNGKVKITYTP
ncbi:MAG: InlB B-repeat-containing protein [Spirochaetaceae bacterium]|jgi:hypothetical protein|nr:InlB B-repeat-containing protein [Spirochaetaceae bacterium]